MITFNVTLRRDLKTPNGVINSYMCTYIQFASNQSKPHGGWVPHANRYIEYLWSDWDVIRVWQDGDDARRRRLSEDLEWHVCVYDCDDE